MRKQTSAFACILLLLLLTAVVLTAHGSGWFDILNNQALLLQWVNRWGIWAPISIVLLQAVQVLLAPIPGQVIGLVSGYLFGAVRGALYSILGTAFGSLVAFGLARALGRPLVERIIPTHTLARLDGSARRRGLLFFVLVFLLPFLPDDLICFAAGLTPIPIPALMLAVLAGRPPGIIVSAWVGANARGLSPRGWALVIASSALLALPFLAYGERLEARVMALVDRLT
jgi:uncharacterized membrane protein YdjX (TVP38/TMEM64 family)